MTTPRILIVDDEDVMRQIMRRVFRKTVCEIQEAKNGKEALEKIPEFQPHLIILDLRMPVLGGLELLKQLDLNKESPYRVVVLSGHPVLSAEAERLKLGIAVLQKPCALPELRAAAKIAFDELNVS